jgi:hypothetical protein
MMDIVQKNVLIMVKLYIKIYNIIKRFKYNITFNYIIKKRSETNGI